MQDVDIYTKSDKFKYGWVTGFYDAKTDEGVRCLDDVLRYGPHSGDNQAFMAGYRAGQQARRGTAVDDSELVSAAFHAAA